MGERLRPLYSARAEDPALSDAIDRFVLGLAEAVDHLQDAHGAGDYTGLERLGRELAGEADSLGYAPLARLAQAVASSAAQEKHEEARSVLVELTEIAQRVRMGHRGAL